MTMKDKVQKELKQGGEFTYLVGKSGTTWGAALRCTNESTQPLYISIGHRISLDTSIDVVKLMIEKFRIPEPIR